MAHAPPACNCGDDAARKALEDRLASETAAEHALGGGAHSSIRQLSARMIAEAKDPAVGPVAAAKQFAPRILRQAHAAELISRSELRDDLQNRTWSRALERVNARIERSRARGSGDDVRRVLLARDENGYNIYARYGADERLLSVTAAPVDDSSATPHMMRARIGGVSLTDAIIARAAEIESGDAARNERMLARVAVLLRWLKSDAAREAGIPTHRALNTDAIRVGDDYVDVVGWNHERRNELDFHSERDDDAVARAAQRLRKLAYGL